MQSLYPTSPSELSVEDLAELYAYPHERRWVRANFVSTIDGAAQGSDHKSGSLSSKSDQLVFSVLRSLCDVVLVGANTTRVEGYLPVRAAEMHAAIRSQQGLAPVPAIAVISRSLDLDPALFEPDAAPTIVITTEASPVEARRTLSEVTPVIVAGEVDVDFSLALDELATRGYPRVLCEGGPTVMRDLVASRRLDELCLTLTPIFAAGQRRRITSGDPLEPPRHMRLRHLLEADGELFARYTKG